MFNPLNLLPANQKAAKAAKAQKAAKSKTRFASGALRVPTGLYILNSGIGKIGADEGTAEFLHGMAVTGIPALKDMDKETFAKFVAYSETGIGAALLTPFVSNRLAGAALATFGAGLLTMYFGNDAMTEDDGIRPSQEGLPLSKDSWLVAIGAALMALPRK